MPYMNTDGSVEIKTDGQVFVISIGGIRKTNLVVDIETAKAIMNYLEREVTKIEDEKQQENDWRCR